MAQPFEQSTKSLWGIEEVNRCCLRHDPVADTHAHCPQILDKQRGIEPDQHPDDAAMNEAQAAAQAELEAEMDAEAEAAAIEASEAEAYAARAGTNSYSNSQVKSDANGRSANGDDAQMHDIEDDFGGIDDEALAAMDMPELDNGYGLPMPPPPGMFQDGEDFSLPEPPAGLGSLPEPPLEFGSLPEPPLAFGLPPPPPPPQHES